MGMMDIELRLEAVERYHNSIRRAELQEQWARITGQPSGLLKYEEVTNRLHIRQQIPLGLQMVALDQIVGSVGRFREFTKTFLPRAQVMLDRWVAVDMTMNSLKGLPPIELYKIGDAYFVNDGNHRISVARANGNKDIEASVTEHQTNVALTADDFRGDRWLIKAAYSEFLAQTGLNLLRPAHKLDVTTPEHYQTLLQHIAVHRYLSNQSIGNFWATLSWEDAVVSWYDTVYLPIVEQIRTRKVQTQFPKRTEADLYIGITQYRECVADQYGLAPLDPETAVTAFAANHSERTLHRLTHTLQQTMRHRLRWRVEQGKIPLGISEGEFCALRLRHDAGELSVTEAGRKQPQEAFFAENLENYLSMQCCA